MATIASGTARREEAINRDLVARARKKKRLDRSTKQLLGVAGVLTFALVWHIVYTMELVNPAFFAGPIETLHAVWDYFASGDVWNDLWVSVQEFLLGLLLSTIVGITVGVLYGTFPRFRAFAAPVVLGWNATPQIALVPVIILWFGIGIWSKVISVFLVCLTVIILNTASGIQTQEEKHLRLAKSFGASKLQTMLTVSLPHALPHIVTGMRLAIGRALITVVVAELFASQAGLGNALGSASASFNTALVFAIVLITCAMGVTLAGAVTMIEKRLASWRS